LNPPEYRDRLTTGIVHFGPGAFHRAHQADYFHRLAGHDPRWGIAAASLRSRGTVDALRRQDGLYTLAILDEETSFRTVGVHKQFFGPDDLDALRRLFLDPAVRVITSTVTEKGYCLAADGTLDFGHADVVHDLARPEQPRSLVGWIALALSVRRSEGLGPPTVICCDNMGSNGRKLERAVSELACRIDPGLARWIEGEVRFPNTMVDSITPATDEALRTLVRERTGLVDAIPVRREAYAEWVIEDVLPADAPDLASAGATLTGDVAAWEKAKLRILNGTHSTLAYLGMLLGHETVAEAMEDKDLCSFVERLIAQDIIPSLQPSSLDLAGYARQTLRRFRNPAIHHRLSQIAWDGSQKLPYRLLGTVAEALTGERSVDLLAIPIAAWIMFLERQFRAGTQVVDPLSDQLRPLALSSEPVRAILSMRQIFPVALGADSAFGIAVAGARQNMLSGGIRATLARSACR
jgi:fructuronate reductase